MITTFFIDRNLGKNTFPRILADAGLHVVKHDDRFAQDTPDEKWIKDVASRGWIGITGDDLLKRPSGRELIRTYDARIVIVTAGNIKTEQRAQNFVNSWHLLERRLLAAKPPIVFKIHRPSPPELIDQGKSGRIMDFTHRLYDEIPVSSKARA
ncbi:MAG: hypothetical protein OXI79_08915 [Gammaproteobacteria bacterium]|nr:hypothetical protein [Gammaproteobacteria bacterium]